MRSLELPLQTRFSGFTAHLRRGYWCRFSTLVSRPGFRADCCVSHDTAPPRLQLAPAAYSPVLACQVSSVVHGVCLSNVWGAASRHACLAHFAVGDLPGGVLRVELCALSGSTACFTTVCIERQRGLC